MRDGEGGVEGADGDGARGARGAEGGAGDGLAAAQALDRKLWQPPWLLLLAQLIVYSAELNVVLSQGRWPRELREQNQME